MMNSSTSLPISHQAENFGQEETDHGNQFQDHLTFWEIIDGLDEKTDLKLVEELNPFKNPQRINKQDQIGRTLLHYAVLRQNEPSIVFLLEHGARFDIEDYFKRTPLMDMPSSAFEKYLNNMISFDQDTFDIVFDLDTFFQKNQNDLVFPTSILYQIQKAKNLKDVILHPTVQLLIYFKWRHVKIIFWLTYVFYFYFCATYTWFIIYKDSNCYICSAAYQSFASVLHRLFTILTISFFGVLDICKLAGNVHLKRYVKEPHLYFRWVIFLLSIIVIACTDSELTFICSQIEIIKGISILSTWIYYYLMITQLPHLTFYLVTFRKAFFQLLLCFSVYLILVEGYALCFYVLFDTSSNNNATESSDFKNPELAFFKAIVMLTGEFEASGLPFENKHPIVSRIIFISYIFVATILLMNVMISIAISGLSKTRKSKRLYANLAKIDLIHSLEDYVFSYNWAKGVFKRFRNNKKEKDRDEENLTNGEKLKIVLNENFLSANFEFEFDGRVKPTQNWTYRIHKRFFKFWFQFCLQESLPESIVKEARKIVSQRIKL